MHSSTPDQCNSMPNPTSTLTLKPGHNLRNALKRCEDQLKCPHKTNMEGRMVLQWYLSTYTKHTHTLVQVFPDTDVP